MNTESIDRQMMDFMHLHKETMRRFFQNCGLFNGHPFYLFFIRTNPGITQRELVEKSNVAAATVAVCVRRMETAGLVKRVRDTEDKRISHLYLTEKGMEIDDKCRNGKEFLNDALYRDFSDEDMEQLSHLLAKMTAGLERAYRSIEINESEEGGKPV